MRVSGVFLFTFEDNGIGMTHQTVEEGLMRIGATAESRKDAGRKTGLSDCAGGFGPCLHDRASGPGCLLWVPTLVITATHYTINML